MATLITLFALDLEGFSVNAGSHIWETSINYAQANEVGEVSIAIVSNKTGAYKRWVNMNPGPDRYGEHIWPDRTITYAYKSEEDKEPSLSSSTTLPIYGALLASPTMYSRMTRFLVKIAWTIERIAY